MLGMVKDSNNPKSADISKRKTEFDRNRDEEIDQVSSSLKNKEKLGNSDGFTPRPMTSGETTAYATGIIPSSAEFSSGSGMSTPILPKLTKIPSEKEMK
jgi:hypothetical protein